MAITSTLLELKLARVTSTQCGHMQLLCPSPLSQGGGWHCTRCCCLVEWGEAEN